MPHNALPIGRAAAARGLVCVALLAGIALSFPLWYGPGRLFPKAPMFAGASVPPDVEGGIVAIAVAGAFVLVVTPARRTGTTIVLCALAVLAALDRGRLQPWAFFYAAMLAALAFPIGTRAIREDDARLATARLIVAATYFWGGLEKANAAFVHIAWPDFAHPLISALPPDAARVVIAGGFAIPAIEVAIAVGLITRPFRRAAVVVAMATHAAILTLLVWSHENTVIWPWNVALPALVVLLFWNAADGPGHVVAPASQIVLAAALVAFAVLPALGLIGLWPPYLSAALYSGNLPQVAVLVDADGLKALPEVVRRSTWQRSKPYFVDLNRWSYDELNVPIYASIAAFRTIGRSVCRAYPRTAYAVVIFERPDWLSGARRRVRYACDDPAW